MNVASLELCRELYELSGWEPNQWWAKSSYSGEWTTIPEKNYTRPTFADEVGAGDFYDHEAAYDLGYLLRKLPKQYNDGVLVVDVVNADKWGAKYYGYHRNNQGHTLGPFIADTPEDATAKLAIELIKQGVLPGVDGVEYVPKSPQPRKEQ